MDACVACGCTAATGERAHRVVDALRVDDLDRAMEHGLLDGYACLACAPDCRALLLEARAARVAALAARDRHRARTARLERRRIERDERRAPVPTPQVAKPALPPAAAAALARAKARAAQRKPE